MLRIGPFLAAIAALAVVCTAFFVRQNAGAQIGGAISVPKILWLSYTIASWFILPAFLSRSPLLGNPLRRLFTAHLFNFTTRGLIELYLLYVTVTWSPLYGIAHDIFSILLITALAPRSAASPVEKAALHFTWSLRFTLLGEIAFAALFHRLTSGEHAIYFAGDDVRFRAINALTSVVVAAALVDLGWVLARLRPSPGGLEESTAHA